MQKRKYFPVVGEFFMVWSIMMLTIFLLSTQLYAGEKFFSSGTMPAPGPQFGIEGGQGVSNADTVLEKLDQEVPTDVEILLSYGKFPSQLEEPIIPQLRGQKILIEWLKHVPKSGLLDKEGNPFGHLAVRVGGTVYTMNGKAVPGVESSVVHSSSLQEYLYGITRSYQHEEHTDTFGESYGRDVLSIRVKGFDGVAIQKMLNQVALVEQQWKSGELRWNKRTFNCADFVISVLKAAGFAPSFEIKKPTMPLDVFDAYLSLFSNNQRLQADLISYSKVVSSKNFFALSFFPISGRQLPRAIRTLLGLRDPVLDKVNYQVMSYPDSTAVSYQRKRCDLILGLL